MTGKAPATGEATTTDAFHRGRFWLVQHEKSGHRAGLDAMLVAGAVPGGFDGHVADLGAGSGAAGLAVVARCPRASAVLVERSPEMVRLANATLALRENAYLSGRASVVQADVTAAAKERAAAGLQDRSFHFIVMNPPFNSGRDRSTPDALKRDAHVMDAAMWEQWLRTAAALARAGAGLALIARPESLPDILAASTGRFGGAELIAVHAKKDSPAIRFVLRARLGSRKRLAIVPPLVLHDADDSRVSERADAICNGQQSLFGD